MVPKDRRRSLHRKVTDEDAIKQAGCAESILQNPPDLSGQQVRRDRAEGRERSRYLKGVFF